VRVKVFGHGWRAMPGQIVRGRNDHPAAFAEFARGQQTVGERAESDGDVCLSGGNVDDPVAQRDVDQDVRVERGECAEQRHNTEPPMRERGADPQTSTRSALVGKLPFGIIEVCEDGRAYESDLMPLAADQGVGALVWSPLGWGRLTGKIGRDRPIPAGSRLHDTEQFAPPVEAEHLYRVIDALEAIAAETGRSVPQVAINWLLRRPTVASVIIGARNEAQLRDNLGAVGWELSLDQVKVLDAASAVLPAYPHTPYHQQEGFARLNPPLV
jgi:hypothetical protein